ncbi:MAG: DEAD/DEAH box helicase family protein [Flavobacteriaceae bacterium]
MCTNKFKEFKKQQDIRNYFGFYCVDAECGRGKTYSAMQYIGENFYPDPFLYVSETTELLEQTYKELVKYEPNLKSNTTIIHSKNNKGDRNNSVANRIYDHIDNLKQECIDILLITWKSFINIERNNLFRNHTVFIDEIPTIDEPHFKKVPYNFNYISDHLELDGTMGEIIGKIKAKDKSKLSQWIKTRAKKDEVYNLFSDLFKDVISNKKDVFVDLKSWNAVVNKNNGSTIYFLSMLNPKAFMSFVEMRTVLLGANIANSMLVDWFERHHKIKKRELQFSLLPKTDLSNRVRISYYFEKTQWSKYFRDKTSPSDELCYGEKMYNCFADKLRNEEFLLVDNNDNTSELDELESVKRISVFSKGMNKYQKYTKIVCIPALNRTPKHLKMLEELGFDMNVVTKSTSYDAFYQLIMRTALRNPNSTEIVDIYVPTENEANWLVGIFGSGVSVRNLGGENTDYIKCEALNNSQKSKNTRANKVIKKRINSDYGSNINLSKYSFTVTEKVNVKNISANHPIWECDNLQSIVSDFKALSKKSISNKKDNFLINPILYIEDEAGKIRLKDNFIQACMMVLDFDDGTVSPQNFKNIFWENAQEIQKRAFIICNSFYRCDEKPNKFRVFLPYCEPATSLEAHQAVYFSIVKRLQQEFSGQTEKEMGIDKTGINGVQGFYAPCTNRNYPDSAFFESFGCGKNDKIKLINPEDYLSVTKVQTPTSNNVRKIVDNDKIDNAKVQRAIDDFLCIPIGHGLRNHGFFICGVKLLKAGLDKMEVRQELKIIAGNDKKLRGRIAGVIKSLYE